MIFNNSKKIFILCFFITLARVNSQDFQLFGEAVQGNLMMGKAEEIKEVYLDDTKLKMDDTPFFVFGFDRDASGSHKLRVLFKNGKTETRYLTVAEREYSIEQIDDIDDKFVSAPASEYARIAREKKLMKNARSKVGLDNSAYYNSGFMLPVWDTVITGEFGSYRIMKGVEKGRHGGVDFDCEEGTPVFAASGGIVQIAGDDFFYNGNFVLIDHGQGLSTIYLHLSKIDVAANQKVRKGDKIGEVGSSGRSTGPHLHWGAQWYNKRIDPMSLLSINPGLNYDSKN